MGIIIPLQSYYTKFKNHIDKAKKQLKDAQKKKNKVDPDDFSAYQEEESKIKQGIKQAQDDLDFWNNIKNAEADAQARAEKEARDAEADEQGRGGATEQNTLPEKNTVSTFDPRSMSDAEKERRGEMLREAEAIEVGKEVITSTPEMSARKAAEKWWDDNVGEPALYETEAGEVEINRNSVESSLAHRYSQMKLDAITSLVDGFENAVYLGTMPDSRERGVLDHYFAYPIIYDGKRCYVFCRAMQDANKNRLYVHEVFVADKIKKGNTLQTAASKPHGGIALYRDILANVLDVQSASEVQNGNSAIAGSGSQSEPKTENGSISNGTPPKQSEGKGSEKSASEQGKSEKNAEDEQPEQPKSNDTTDALTKAQKDAAEFPYMGRMGTRYTASAIRTDAEGKRYTVQFEGETDIDGNSRERRINLNGTIPDGATMVIFSPNGVIPMGYASRNEATGKYTVWDMDGEHLIIDGERRRITGGKVDSQGNPLNNDGTLKVVKIKSVNELADDDFDAPTRSVQLPKLPQKVDDAIGANGKPVIIKKNIFEKNKKDHPEVTAEQSREILQSALFNPDIYGQNQKTTRPYNWVLIRLKDKANENKLVLLEVNHNKDSIEVVHWHYVRDKSLDSIKRQAEREGGLLLMLPSHEREEAGGLSGRTPDKSSVGKDSKKDEEKQEAADTFLTKENSSGVQGKLGVKLYGGVDYSGEVTVDGKTTGVGVYYDMEALPTEEPVGFFIVGKGYNNPEWKATETAFWKFVKERGIEGAYLDDEGGPTFSKLRDAMDFKDYLEAMDKPNPVGKGPFGNIYDQFKGKAKEAIKFLMGKKEGEAVGALHHHKVGDISLVWGDSKAGLKKILAKHPEVINNLQDIIDGMEIVSESDNRIKLESPTHFAVISKEYKGKPRDKWLLTAYEKKGSGASDGSMGIGSEPKGKQNGTAPLQNPSSTGKGNNSSANGKKDDKITDFGEKIGGSRKDEAQAALELLSKKTKKDIAKVKKADDILSKKLIEKMHDEGRMSHEAARALFAMNSITDMLGTKLKKAVDGGTLFGIIANTYADAVKKWSSNPDAFKLTSAEIAQTIEKYFREHCPADVDAQNIKYVAWAIKEWLPAIIDTYKEVGNEGRGRLSYVIREVSNKAGTKYWVMRVGSSRGYAFGTREAALTKLRELCPVKETKPAKGKDTKTGSTSHLRIVQSGNGLRIKSTRINGEIYLSGLFYNRPAAEAYLQEHAEELSKIEESYAALLGTANVLQVEREGLDYRNGHDVTPEEFQKQFGFRGVEFGNWVTQKERQPYLNTTYDALMDLASILGLSPKALSLGGRLGLSFGGRGRGGKYSAHYESDYEVINLTRTKGAGSLAHEWFHAVDNYLARSKSGNVSDFSTETRGFIDGMREELSKAFDDLVTTIKFSNYDDRSRRAGEYWHRTREEAARAFELYIEDKLEEKSGVSPMLTRRVDDPESMATTDTEKKAAAEASSSWPYPTTEERKKINKAFDNLFNTIQEKTDPAGNVVLFHKTESAEAPLTKEQIAIRDGMAEHLNRTGLQTFADEELGQRIVDEEEQRIREKRAASPENVGIQFFRSSAGEILGFTVGGKIYLDPRKATPETAFHEYGHIWLEALKQGNRKEYDSLMQKVKDDAKLTPIWEEVKKNYPGLSDEALTEEVFVMYSGRKGSRRIEERIRQIAAQRGMDITQKATTISALQQLKQAIQNAWRGILDFLHINYKNVDEAVEQQVKDFIMGNNPLDALARHQGRNTAEEPADIRFQFAGEKGARNLDTAEERTERIDNLSIAREMEAAKKDAKAIKLATGWERGADGLWRYEIPDAQYTGLTPRRRYEQLLEARKRLTPEQLKKLERYENLNTTPEQQREYEKYVEQLGLDKLGYWDDTMLQEGHGQFKLTEMLSGKGAEQLFKAYPELRRIVVLFKPLDNGTYGQYKNSDHTITLNSRYFADGFEHGSDLRTTLLHEIQHVIQDKEGFAKGGTVYTGFSIAHHSLTDEERYFINLVDTYKEYRKLNGLAEYMRARLKYGDNFGEQINKLLPEMSDDDIIRLSEEYKKKEISPYEVYRRTAGEVEARNVERRNDMTEEERRQTLAKETEDVAPEDQIFLRGEGDNAESRRRPFGGNSGYDGYSKSRRAEEAERRGLRNKSQMDKTFADEVNRHLQQLQPGHETVTLANIRRELSNIHADEWHHTSMYGNRTNYYSAETIANHFADKQTREQNTIEQAEQGPNKYIPHETVNTSDGPRIAYKSKNGLYFPLKVNNITGTLEMDGYYPLAIGANEKDRAKNSPLVSDDYLNAHIREIDNAVQEYFDVAADAGQKYNAERQAATAESRTREEDVEEVNKKFNEELQEQIDGKQESGHVYQLGMPSAELQSTGIPSLPIRLQSSILNAKTNDPAHQYDLAEIKDLVRLIQRPIAIFAYGNKEKAQNLMIGISQQGNEGKQFLVGLSLRPTVKGQVLEINSVRNVFPKNYHDWIHWINQGKMLRVDGKKEIQDIIDALRINPVDYISNDDLDSAAKLVQEFENPPIEGEKNSSEGRLGSENRDTDHPSDIIARTSSQIDAEYPNWLEGTTTGSGKHTTQVAGTRKTYGHVGDWIEKHLGKDVRILDASSGMGYGTKDLRERGFNIEDVEPYQSEERKRENPATYSSYDDVNGKYDYIISNAVLNVIPDDWRRDVLHDMADRLNEGGRLFINTRKAGEEKHIKDKIELDSPREVLVKRGGRIASYQRFFTPEELRDYVADELGNGYKVEIAGEENSGTKGLAAVVVTKEEADGRDIPISRTETTDPVETFLSRKGGNRSQAPTKEQQEQMKGAAESAAKALHLGNVRIITTPKADDPNSGLKAYYDKATGQIVIYAGNHVDNADIVQSVLHEGVAHYGLRQLLGDKFDTFLDEVYAAATPEIRKRVDHIRQRDGYSSQHDGTGILLNLSDAPRNLSGATGAVFFRKRHHLSTINIVSKTVARGLHESRPFNINACAAMVTRAQMT